jgi:hypothetical protein
MARSVPQEQLAKAKNELLLHASVLRGFCVEEHADLQRQIAAGADPRRLVAVLGDPVTEAVVADLITPVPVRPAPTGLRARLLRWWRN